IPIMESLPDVPLRAGPAGGRPASPWSTRDQRGGRIAAAVAAHKSGPLQCPVPGVNVRYQASQYQNQPRCDCRQPEVSARMVMSSPRTMFEKIWDSHVVHAEPGQQTLLYIDLHLVHEVTSPQAFEGLRLAGRRVRRPELTVATPDHNVPTTDRGLPIADEISRKQVDTLRNNCAEFGVKIYDLNDPR